MDYHGLSEFKSHPCAKGYGFMYDMEVGQRVGIHIHRYGGHWASHLGTVTKVTATQVTVKQDKTESVRRFSLTTLRVVGETLAWNKYNQTHLVGPKWAEADIASTEVSDKVRQLRYRWKESSIRLADMEPGSDQATEHLAAMATLGAEIKKLQEG